MPRVPSKRWVPSPAKVRSRPRPKPHYEPPIYRFRVRLWAGPDTGGETSDQVVREIELAANQPFAALGHAIPAAFDFDEDHLWAFFLSGKAWDSKTEWGLDADYAGRADGVMVRDVPFPGAAGKKEFLYIFDFGDDWRFRVKLLRMQPAVEAGVVYPQLVSSVGVAPPQYRNWDEEDAWDNEDDSEDF